MSSEGGPRVDAHANSRCTRLMFTLRLESVPSVKHNSDFTQMILGHEELASELKLQRRDTYESDFTSLLKKNGRRVGI